MQTTTVTIIGAGQAGLAMSRSLSERAIDHVVLERADVANSWRTERWDSLRLLTPNWLARLPGWAYDGPDPDGYMTANEVVDYLDGYRDAIAAPVQTNTTVLSVTPRDDHHMVTTDHGQITCRAVVVATGAGSTPQVPAIARDLPAKIRQIAPIHYHRPEDLDDGPVLIVGASASGIQLADELARHGHDITLAVGAHTRLPRTYRGRDIHWWLDAMGVLDTRYDEVDDIAKARRLPSLQLIGTPEHRTLDLNTLTSVGVEVLGRLVGISGRRAQLSGSLANVCADADLKMGRLLHQIDTFAREHDLDIPALDNIRPSPTTVPSPRTSLDLAEISTIIWATGSTPRYPWLPDACLDRRGAIIHEAGITTTPGMYVLGQPFTRTRKSNFLDGVGPDAQYLAAHLANHLGRAAAQTTGAPTNRRTPPRLQRPSEIGAR